MKVVHLSLHDRYGGACIAAYRQHTALLKAGVDSQMWVRFKVTNDPQVVAFTPPLNAGNRSRRLMRRFLLDSERRWSKVRGELFDDRSEHGGAELTPLPEADVYNLQFAWNFIDYPHFFHSLPAHQPVVVTMHEMSHFTGGCSYTSGCSRFQTSCGHCPKIQRRGSSDFSRRGWERRKAAYDRVTEGPVHFVADSHWLAAEARKSSLLSRARISVIHYGLDTAVYRPMDRTLAKLVLGVPLDKRVVSFAAAAIDDQRKGIKHVIEAIENIANRPFLLTWGRSVPPAMNGIEHRHLGNIEDEHLMALAYAAADVFVMPSLEEAFGQTALESIACGTPVVAFAAGGIVDTVRHEKTGLLAEVGSSMALAESITRFLKDRELWRKCSQEGVRVACAEFSLEHNARSYVNLYESLAAKK